MADPNVLAHILRTGAADPAATAAALRRQLDPRAAQEALHEKIQMQIRTLQAQLDEQVGKNTAVGQPRPDPHVTERQLAEAAQFVESAGMRVDPAMEAARQSLGQKLRGKATWEQQDKQWKHAADLRDPPSETLLRSQLTGQQVQEVRQGWENAAAAALPIYECLAQLEAQLAPLTARRTVLLRDLKQLEFEHGVSGGGSDVRAPSPAVDPTPRHTITSNARVTLPAIDKWKVEDAAKHRSVDTFIKDCALFARAARQDLTHTVGMTLCPQVREGWELESSHRMALKGGQALSMDEVVDVFKAVVGLDLVDLTADTHRALIKGEHQQKSGETVSAYGIRMRLLHRRVPTISQKLMCEFFVQGLTDGGLARSVACKDDASAWEDLAECIRITNGKAHAAALRGGKPIHAAPAYEYGGRGGQRGGRFGRGDGRFSRDTRHHPYKPFLPKPPQGYNAMNRAQQNGLYKRGRCNACLAYGHYAHECPNATAREYEPSPSKRGRGRGGRGAGRGAGRG
ncbi:MAG: hypothetical protein EOM56_12885 [Deltaproteobacteria bacterium]|nr:hypothetical protein [Deltaproteobacteria bacterium]